MTTAKTPILFDDVDAIGSASEEVFALLTHARGIAYLLEQAAANNGTNDPAEIWQVMMGLVFRIYRVRYAIEAEHAALTA